MLRSVFRKLKMKQKCRRNIKLRQSRMNRVRQTKTWQLEDVSRELSLPLGVIKRIREEVIGD